MISVYEMCKFWVPLQLIFVISLTLGCKGKSTFQKVPPKRTVFKGRTMGTFWQVIISHPSSPPRKYHDWKSQLEQSLNTELEKVNQLMSVFDPKAQMARFNKHKSTDPFSVSFEIAQLLESARKICLKTGGAFDMTVGPLIDAWGFGTSGRKSKSPTKEELTKMRNAVGCDMVEINLVSGSLRKLNPNVICNLGGIAKGYGVDRLARLLDQLGHKNYLVDIGGELRAKGRNHRGEFWQVGVEKPLRDKREVELVTPLKNASMATSGDYRNFHKVDGVLCSHTINPHTGRPIAHKLASATVVHNECTSADAYATAMMVLGPEKAKELASKHKLAVFLLIHDGKGGFLRWMTPQFKEPLSSYSKKNHKTGKNRICSTSPFSGAKSALGRTAGGSSIKSWENISFTVLGAILFVGLAMTGLAIGRILGGRPLRGGCCGGKGAHANHTNCANHAHNDCRAGDKYLTEHTRHTGLVNADVHTKSNAQEKAPCHSKDGSTTD